MNAGNLLREWRTRRRMSQLSLALEADISARHLSFLETGRARPSREMVLHLAERLEIPLRERNALLVAAGFAPSFPERKLDDPEMASARAAIDLVLAGHEPYPALAVDRHWNLVAANRAVAPFFQGIDESLVQPPVNVLRASLHPKGLAPRIANYDEWRTHVLDRLRRQIDVSADPVLIALYDELRALPRQARAAAVHRDYAGVVVPLELTAGDDCVLRFFSTTTIFGTPVDVTLQELAVESFFPADSQTAAALA
ncbi:MAG TPA: helix-turn-helix transcriptional regulator, partial [Thermoanaerobaculia bacterium]